MSVHNRSQTEINVPYLKASIIQLIAIIAVFIAIDMCSFVIDEREQAVVLQLGEVKWSTSKAGLYFKFPWQKAVFVEKRLVQYNSEPAEVIDGEKQALLVDTFGFFRIIDPVAFTQSLGTLDNAQSRMDVNVYSNIRSSIGHRSLENIVSKDREGVVKEVGENLIPLLKDLSLEAELIGINQVGLHDQTKASVFGRMQAERTRTATGIRSEGEENYLKITSNADREATQLVAAAEKRSREISGEAEAAAARIYNDAYGRDPKFFSFVRGLNASRMILGNPNSQVQLIETGKEPYLRHLFHSGE